MFAMRPIVFVSIDNTVAERYPLPLGSREMTFPNHAQNVTQKSPGPQREKTCLREFMNNNGADQLAHSRRLIRSFVIRFWENTYITFKLATCEISIF